MKYSRDELEWVTNMVRVAKKDRNTYRRLRQAAWELVAVTHQQQTPEQRDRWLKNSS